jgi:hypothetical protein
MSSFDACIAALTETTNARRFAADLLHAGRAQRRVLSGYVRASWALGRRDGAGGRERQRETVQSDSTEHGHACSLLPSAILPPTENATTKLCA